MTQTRTFAIRLTEPERLVVEARAKSAGLSPAAWAKARIVGPVEEEEAPPARTGRKAVGIIQPPEASNKDVPSNYRQTGTAKVVGGVAPPARGVTARAVNGRADIPTFFKPGVK